MQKSFPASPAPHPQDQMFSAYDNNTGWICSSAGFLHSSSADRLPVHTKPSPWDPVPESAHDSASNSTKILHFRNAKFHPEHPHQILHFQNAKFPDMHDRNAGIHTGCADRSLFHTLSSDISRDSVLRQHHILLCSHFSALPQQCASRSANSGSSARCPRL